MTKCFFASTVVLSETRTEQNFNVLLSCTLGLGTVGSLVYKRRCSLHSQSDSVLPRNGNALHFSQVNNCGDFSPSIARVFVAVLLAASKFTNCPTPNNVMFGMPKSHQPTTGPSRLSLRRQLIMCKIVYHFL
jgi:hypothetical protein